MAKLYRRRFPRSKISKKTVRKVVKASIYRNLERKYGVSFLDTMVTADVGFQPTTIWQMRNILNDSIATQGVAVANRIGRSMRLLYIDFILRLVPRVSAVGVDTADVTDVYGNACRFCVVHDTDATITGNNYATDLIKAKVWDLELIGGTKTKDFATEQAAANDTEMYSQRNFDYMRRFRIKKDILHVMTTTALNGTIGTAYARAATGEGMYQFRVPFRGGLKLQMQSDSQSGATDGNANFIKNDVFVMWCGNASGCCSLQYKARAVFVDG